MKKLTKYQLEFFKEQGYLVFEDAIDHKYLDAVIADLEKEIDRRARELHQAGELSGLYDDLPFSTRLAKISQETPKLAVSIWNGILHSPGIFSLITAEPLLDVMEDIFGEEIIASSVYRLRPKIPNYGYGEVPWHQDSAYFEPYCDDLLIITSWIPLVDANEENGCMWVIPGSHKEAVVEHQTHETGKYLEIRENFLPKENWVCCPVRKGGMLLLTNKVMHGSFKNKTEGVRWSMDLRYQHASAPTNADITRLEGEVDPSIMADAPAACFPPEADFLVRSKKRPDQIIDSYESFKNLREQFKGQPVTNRFNVKWKEMREEEV
jgi:hypothetical protein